MPMPSVDVVEYGHSFGCHVSMICCTSSVIACHVIDCLPANIFAISIWGKLIPSSLNGANLIFCSILSQACCACWSVILSFLIVLIFGCKVTH